MKCSVFKVAFFVLVGSAVSHLYSDTLHEVQKGETLYSISKTYGVSVSAIQEANGLSDNGIKVGQKIKIPDGAAPATAKASSSTPASSPAAASSTSSKTTAPASSDGTYVVQKGETWFGISKKYSISVADLQKLNGVGSDAALKVGQKIKVPTASGSTAVASAKSNTTSVSATKTTTAKVPDLAKNDPHTYSSKKADSSLVWPVKTDSIVYINGKVGGVSMAAKKDEEVKAIRAGTVMFSGSYRGFGNVVFIQSKTGHIYAYTGLGSIDVSKGDYINYSTEIGTAGIDTYTGKSQISLMVFQNGQPIDPAKAPRG
ncbi:MAG: LysM peptidoglycan-binding domain-containing M23 family metallopeptidase [Treponema sp.]|nr:LysM peptidoglycan-binding domain-containing M23 family metallopeptidase [Treponema sp.]